MADEIPFERWSFYTKGYLSGWADPKTPIWSEMLKFNGVSNAPIWHDWEGVKDGLIAPLCDLADSATIYGNQWLIEKPEAIELRQFVNSHCKLDRKRLICVDPRQLVDQPLLWMGETQLFILVPVLSFRIERFGAVLDVLRYHRSAGKMSLCYGTPYTSVNKFARSAVEKGGFAVIVTGDEAEIYFPLERKDEVMNVVKEVVARTEAEVALAKIAAL